MPNVSTSGRQSITTRYLGPTNSRGSRIKATCEAGSVTIPYAYERSNEYAHVLACEALLAKFGWGGRYVGGATATGYVFVEVL